jgi:hypothetical protein
VRPLVSSRTGTPGDDTRGTTGIRHDNPIERTDLEAGGRHRRRRADHVTPTALDEARRAGLVRRHLTKLRYLAERVGRGPEPGEAAAEAPHSTSDAA